MMKSIQLPTARDLVSILGNDFFKEEVRCDYLVTEKMKKVWAVNIDLYLEFARICDKHGLRYYAYAGTLLGAIRHKGYIPWDDDVDVAMPRTDYEKFIKIAPGELSNPYFLQTPQSDPEYFRTIARVLNLKTTCTTGYFLHSGMMNTLALDIFPLDECNPDTNEQEMEEIFVSAKRCSEYLKRNDTKILTPEQYAKWEQYMTNDPMKEWENVQNIAMRWHNSNLDCYCMKVHAIPGSRYNKPIKKTWFNSIEKKPFEGIEVVVPSEYDSLLKSIYGDYMQLPPVEQRGTWHNGVILDTDKPYTDYL